MPSAPPPTPPATGLADALGVTLEEFAGTMIEGLENVLRKAEQLLERHEEIESYLALGEEHLASTPEPGSVSGPGAPANLQELRRHPQKRWYLNAT